MINHVPKTLRQRVGAPLRISGSRFPLGCAQMVVGGDLPCPVIGLLERVRPLLQQRILRMDLRERVGRP